ncbi:hypothetical protein BC830DRAFT_424736 [Chytriomyces sp. MP71]|nr:hypothetical protein BC830DRAFT_424736 [Chytriomyces sp. MP71]
MTRWLISTSRADLANAGGSWKEGINLMARSIPPSVECALNLRLFCIRVLGILTHANREVSICLLSLFSDTKPTVRDAAARAMSIRSLNNDPLNFHAQICSSASRRSVHHRESGDCICSADPDKYSFGHSDLDRYAPNQAPSTYFGLSASLKYPFKNLIWCLDATIGSKNDLEGDGETKIFWQGSSDERATVGRLAFYVARHMFSICPVLANPDFSSKYSSNLHLPVLSDPRYKAALRAIQELETRYKRHSSVRSTDSVPEKLDQSWCMCQCITLCVVGILEGSKSVDMVPNCDPRVLRAASPLLFQIRVNDSASIRIILLEALARMLGLGALVDEMNETGGWENKFVTDSLLKNSSFVDSESLNIVYRVVRGMAPLDTLAIAQRDDIDNHPRVASLRDALLNYFEISLVRSLRHSPEESRSYRPVHFPTSHNEIPQKCISTFDWAKRMNSNLFFKRVSVANLNSPTLPETLHIEARQDLSQYSSAEINPVEHTEVVSSILQRMDKEEIDLLATYSNRLLRSELQVQQVR